MISPILTYGAEVWSQQFYKILSKFDLASADVLAFEKVHSKVCKQLLGVRKNVSNIATRLELGRLPLYLTILKNTFNFWVKLENMPENSLLGVCLQSEKDLVSNNCVSWYSFIQKMFLKLNVSAQYKIKDILTQKYKENIDEWFSETRTNGNGNKLRTYVKFKRTQNIEEYVTTRCISRHDKRQITKFRISDHNLKIETGRHYRPKLPPEERICEMRKSTEIEDEFHFLFKCELYNDSRKKYDIF